jgi:hypothetical protein
MVDLIYTSIKVNHNSLKATVINLRHLFIPLTASSQSILLGHHKQVKFK